MADPSPAGEPYRVLGPDDPEPVQVLRPRGRSAYFLTCEHAGKIFPRRLGTLGVTGADLERHITWDIGAAAVARRLSELLDAACVLQTYSRLVVDCNRWPPAEDFICTLSEKTEIPGNVGISEVERQAREREIFHPYHDTIHAMLDGRRDHGAHTVLVAVHSCTPVFHGISRPWHIGILYEHDRRVADILMQILKRHEDLFVGDNEPYFMTAEKDYAVPVHGHNRGIPHVELEIRQDLITSEAGQIEWAERLRDVLTEALAVFRERSII